MFLTISYPTAWTEGNAIVWGKAVAAFCEKAAKAFSMKMEVE